MTGFTLAIAIVALVLGCLAVVLALMACGIAGRVRSEVLESVDEHIHRVGLVSRRRTQPTSDTEV